MRRLPASRTPRRRRTRQWAPGRGSSGCRLTESRQGSAGRRTHPSSAPGFNHDASRRCCRAHLLLALRYSRMNLGLRNKVAMVGGASKGLGYAIARVLAAEGAQVSIASRDGDAIRSAAETLSRDTGSPVVAVAADLSRADAIERWHAD